MLDANLVFHKTETGVAEVATPAHGLSPRLRRALIVVDGAKSVADLSPLFRPGEIDAILRDLRDKGLIATAGGAGEAPASEATREAPDEAAGVVPAVPFDEVRRRAMREISDRLGPNGDTLALRIERCRTPEELRVALREAETILASFLGADYGRSFAQRIGRDLL